MPGTLNVPAVFCLILIAKINAIPGDDSKELRMDHRAKFSPYLAAAK